MKLQANSLVRISVLFVTIFSTSDALAQKRPPMTLVDLLQVPTLSDPQLSPDGTQLLYVLAKADWKANKQVRHIWRIDVDSKRRVQMTAGTGGETSPCWSPGGLWIAFLAKRGDAPANQIYLLSNRGGEAQQLTEHETAVSNIAWSADGAFIYFLAPDPKTEAQKQRETLRDDVLAFDEDYQQRHLWKIALADKVETKITQGDYSVLDYKLSRDGKKVAFHRSPNPLYGDSDQGEVWVMNADGTEARRLTENRIPESSAQLSPDNAHVLFLAKSNEDFQYYYNANIFVVPVQGGEAKLLLPDLPYEVFQARWGKDGRSIFFTANMGVHVELFRLDMASKDLNQLTDGEHAIRSWQYNPKSDRHVVSLDKSDNPGDVWLLHTGGTNLGKQITHEFDYLVRDFQLPQQKRIRWKGADGVTVEGLLFYPLGYRRGQAYPLVVQAHGGPASSDRFGFGRWRDYLPVLAAKGYTVIKPNYRGSTGYGNAFLRDMVGHYYKNAHLDVVAGVDHLIEQGIADRDQLVMMGWSGGGHMTNKIITFTDRFQAASSGAGAVNWVSMYAQSDVRIYRTPWFGGTPWQKDAPIEVYWEHSPLKYIANAKTPTIILVGENDVRVPSPQSVELYRALKAAGVPTHLYIAPREPHGWRELQHRLFKMNVELEWFEKHARNRQYTWEKAPAKPGDKES